MNVEHFDASGILINASSTSFAPSASLSTDNKRIRVATKRFSNQPIALQMTSRTKLLNKLTTSIDSTENQKKRNYVKRKENIIEITTVENNNKRKYVKRKENVIDITTAKQKKSTNKKIKIVEVIRKLPIPNKFSFKNKTISSDANITFPKIISSNNSIISITDSIPTKNTNYVQSQILMNTNSLKRNETTNESGHISNCHSNKMVSSLSKSLWEINIETYNEGMNFYFNKLNLKTYDIKLEAFDFEMISNNFKTVPLNVGYVIDINEKNKFITSLPNNLKQDYNNFKEQYTIIDYSFFNDIFKSLHGTNSKIDYKNKKHLPLYFNFYTKKNNLIVVADKCVIDIKKSYDLLKVPISVSNDNYDSNDPDFIVVIDQKNKIINLPYYQKDNVAIHIKIWIYLHLTRIFILSNFTGILDDNKFIFCPTKIICCLSEYSKMVTYIGNNCKRFSYS